MSKPTLSHFFEEKIPLYSSEIEYLGRGSDGNHSDELFEARIQDKISEFSSLVDLAAIMPEMIAVIFKEIRVRKGYLHQILESEEDELPKWQPSQVTIPDNLVNMVDRVLGSIDGEKAMVMIVALNSQINFNKRGQYVE